MFLRWRLFSLQSGLFSLDFTGIFFLPLSSFYPEDRLQQSIKYWLFGSRLAELKQLSVPLNMPQMDNRSQWKKIWRAQFVNTRLRRCGDTGKMVMKGNFKTSKSPSKAKRICNRGLTQANRWIVRVRVSRHCVVFWRVRRAHFDYPLYLPRYGCILYISHTKLCTFAIFKVRKIAAVRMTVRHVVFDFWPCHQTEYYAVDNISKKCTWHD